MQVETARVPMVSTTRVFCVFMIVRTGLTTTPVSCQAANSGDSGTWRRM